MHPGLHLPDIIHLSWTEKKIAEIQHLKQTLRLIQRINQRLLDAENGVMKKLNKHIQKCYTDIVEDKPKQAAKESIRKRLDLSLRIMQTAETMPAIIDCFRPQFLALSITPTQDIISSLEKLAAQLDVWENSAALCNEKIFGIEKTSAMGSMHQPIAPLF